MTDPASNRPVPPRFGWAVLTSAVFLVCTAVLLSSHATKTDAPFGSDASDPMVTDASPDPTAPGFATPWPADAEVFTTGFLEFPLERSEDPAAAHDAGFSMYVAAWPFQETYPGSSYQTGLPSTWLYPAEAEGVEGDNYSTIEGGLGWWNDTRFATETPKFIMGGVARGFSEWANGPGAGAGTNGDVDRRDWTVPQGKYGVAQLSPHVLWPPDGLNLAQGTNGALFGYGYHPLPIIGHQQPTASPDGPVGVSTGDRSWTLFLSTGNFQGPVSFFIPNFFSRPAVGDPTVEGVFFDSSATTSGRVVSMETQVIPSAAAVGPDGISYARITTTQFPASDDDSSIILHRVASYTASAVIDRSAEWPEPGSGRFEPGETRFGHFEPIDASDSSSYTIIYEGIEEADEYPIDWAALAEVDVSDPLSFRYRWNLDVVDRVDDHFVLPQYYRLGEAASGPTWTPIPESGVPAETGLVDHRFAELGERNDGEAYATPTEEGSVWRTPGPAMGPFEAELGDGSLVTYSWYRFVDQPAIQYWGFSDDHLAAIQVRVEDIHREWGPEQTYLEPPSVGSLAELDPAILVAPPEGLEVGYVPIVTRQALASG